MEARQMLKFVEQSAKRPELLQETKLEVLETLMREQEKFAQSVINEFLQKCERVEIEERKEREKREERARKAADTRRANQQRRVENQHDQHGGWEEGQDGLSE